jgi:hypothetical protein
MVSGMPPVPFPERCYRWFWWRKADVFRLFMSLQNVIDGCTWPQHDAKRVQELLGLIHHVTGAHQLLVQSVAHIQPALDNCSDMCF